VNSNTFVSDYRLDRPGRQMCARHKSRSVSATSLRDSLSALENERPGSSADPAEVAVPGRGGYAGTLEANGKGLGRSGQAPELYSHARACMTARLPRVSPSNAQNELGCQCVTVP
jgi:hypothetical protein